MKIGWGCFGWLFISVILLVVGIGSIKIYPDEGGILLVTGLGSLIVWFFKCWVKHSENE